MIYITILTPSRPTVSIFNELLSIDSQTYQLTPKTARFGHNLHYIKPRNGFLFSFHQKCPLLLYNAFKRTSKLTHYHYLKNFVTLQLINKLNTHTQKINVSHSFSFHFTFPNSLRLVLFLHKLWQHLQAAFLYELQVTNQKYLYLCPN